MGFTINPYTGEFDRVGTGGGGVTLPIDSTDVDPPDSVATGLGLPANANLAAVLIELELRVRFFEHLQAVAATTWSITHNLGVSYPSITVLDGTGELVIGYDINPVSVNQLDLVFAYNIDGRAELYR